MIFIFCTAFPPQVVQSMILGIMCPSWSRDAGAGIFFVLLWGLLFVNG